MTAERPDRPPAAPLSPAQRVLVLSVTAAVVCLNWFPSPQLKSAARHLAGAPERIGPWLLVEHFFLYTTLTALAALLAWWWLARRGLLPPPRASLSLGDRRRTIVAGLVVGLVVSAVVLSLAGASGQARFHSPEVDAWSGLGNAVSNLCEEIVFSGLVLLALVAVTGRRAVAVVLASLLVAAVHTQYPLELRALVAVNGALMASVRLWTGSLWTSWIAHQLSDLVIDAVLL